MILRGRPTSRRAFIISAAAAASIALSTALASQRCLAKDVTQLDVTGLYNTTSSGDYLVTMPLRLQQSGATVIGSYGQTGHFLPVAYAAASSQRRGGTAVAMAG